MDNVCSGDSSWDEIAEEILKAMLEIPEEMHKFEIDDNLFDWSCTCNYCGGHKFAYQAVIKKALKNGT